jgi:hypothetical protein
VARSTARPLTAGAAASGNGIKPVEGFLREPLDAAYMPRPPTCPRCAGPLPVVQSAATVASGASIKPGEALDAPCPRRDLCPRRDRPRGPLPARWRTAPAQARRARRGAPPRSRDAGDEAKARGWAPVVIDTNGNGKIDDYVEPNQVVDPDQGQAHRRRARNLTPTNANGDARPRDQGSSCANRAVHLWE